MFILKDTDVPGIVFILYANISFRDPLAVEERETSLVSACSNSSEFITMLRLVLC